MQSFSNKMSSYNEYLNNESNSEPSINKFEYLFKDYINNPPSLEDALIEMFVSEFSKNKSKVSEDELKVFKDKSKSLCDEIISRVDEYLKVKFSEIKSKYKNITYEDAQIITSYTCELNNKYNFSPFKILNSNLVENDRKSGISNISKYLFILLKALRKLDRYYPDKERNFLYRGINRQVELKYEHLGENKKKVPYFYGENKKFFVMKLYQKLMVI